MARGQNPALHRVTKKRWQETMTLVIRILTGLFVLLLASCGPKEEVEYYSTGEVECRAPLNERGQYDGEVKSFYKNGMVKNTMPFHNNRINGLIRRYYPNGKLESTEFFKNGQNFGPIKHYYPTGQLEYETTQYGKVHVDTARYYHPNGELSQKIIYDKKGRKTDYAVWQLNGAVDSHYTRPIFLSEGDSLREGEDLLLSSYLATGALPIFQLKYWSRQSG